MLDAGGSEETLDVGLGSIIHRGYAALRLATHERARSRRLCQSLARFRAPTPSAALQPEPRIVQTNAAGIITQASETVARFLNVPAERLIGMHLLHFVGRRDTRVFRAIVKGLGYAGATRAAEVRFRPRQGRQELVHATVEKVAPDRYAWSLRSIGQTHDAKG